MEDSARHRTPAVLRWEIRDVQRDLFDAARHLKQLLDALPPKDPRLVRVNNAWQKVVAAAGLIDDKE